MKHLRLLLALIVASLCSWQGAWAERVAPTFPEAQTLESGNTYYLYNVGSQKFMYRSDSYVRANATARTGIIITDKEDGTYTMQFSDNNYYIWTSSSDMKTQSGVDADVYFRFAEVEGGYTIQRNRNYDETNYVANNSDYYVYADQTSGNIVWQLFDAEAVVHYKAKKALYDALEAAVGYEFATADYEAIYANEASTTAELNAAATALNKSLSMSKGYKAPWWNERPILFYTADGSFGQNEYYTWALPYNSYTSGTYFYRRIDNGQSRSISATVLVEEPSTLVYGTDGGQGHLVVSVDGVQKDLDNAQYRTYPSSKTHTRFFEELEPGLHTITWTFNNNSSSSYSYYLYDVSVMSKPQITVNLLEPGSLGTEVLYNTDHIKNVRRLKVKGALNSDDWGRIKMMSTLLELDLSEAQFTEIPASQFKVSWSDTTMNFLHKVILPEGLTTIGDYAFHYSFVEDINLPSTMKRVGKEAFEYSHVKELIMPDDMTDFYGGSDGGYCFEYMYWLKKLVLAKNLTRIPRSTFYNCAYITEAVMPEKLQTVGEYAFSECHRLQTTLPEGLKTIEGCGFYNCPTLNSLLPSTLTTIGEYAFQYARGYKSLVIPQSVTSIGQYAFANCTNMTKVELSVNQYSLANGVFQGCSKLDTLKLMSPTVTTISSTYPLSDITKMVLQVPHYLVNSYKLHSYWYNAKAIEPFDYSDVELIPIHGGLTLNHERFGGQPSVNIYNYNSYLKINGDVAQAFNNFSIWRDYNDSYGYGMMLSNCQNLSIAGDARVVYKANAKQWNFISLPFDLDVSRLNDTDVNGIQYALRYYDGAGRAANGKSGNWKNVDRTSIIPAGTGFILQTNKDCWFSLYAADNEAKQNIVGCDEFNKSLDVNASETASNKGWNLVGNPYQCYYNNHCLNFTAPITVWNGSTYVAYSLTDDDYAIRPNEAFFVQCPNEEYATIGFPIQGRQLTSVIESQNAARAAEASERRLIDVELSSALPPLSPSDSSPLAGAPMSDKTRFVLNPEADMCYELSRDASKFFSMDAAMPQIYTVEGGELLAINERPLGEGTVQIGFRVAQDGQYTITALRNQFQNIVLVDNETGMETDLTTDSYTFTADAGTWESRFVLRVGGAVVTAVQYVATESQQTGPCYNLQGQRIAEPQKGLYIVNGKKVMK